MDETGPARADPDSRARTHLANERTFLAWLRTGLNLIALGLVAAQLLEQELFSGIPIVTLFAALLVGSGVAMVGAAGVHFDHSRAAIETGTYRSNARVIVVGAALVIGIGLTALALVFLLRQGR